jgi:hypothetical protein
LKPTNIEAVVKQFGPSTKIQGDCWWAKRLSKLRSIRRSKTFHERYYYLKPRPLDHVKTENQTQVLININAVVQHDEITTVYKAIGAKIEHLDSVERTSC